MYERSYGSKYAKGGEYRSAADIAKDMRADIKAAKASGEIADDVEVSVKVDNYSGGRSINVKVLYRDEFWQVCDGSVPGTRQEFEGGGYTARACPNVWCAARNNVPVGGNYDEHSVLTVEGQRIKAVLAKIHWAYNYDGSDVMTDYFDVNFYGHVEMEDARSAEWRQRETERQRSMRANAAAKKELIAHLLAEHKPYSRRTLRPMKPGNLRAVSFERLTEMHNGLHDAAEKGA